MNINTTNTDKYNLKDLYLKATLNNDKTDECDWSLAGITLFVDDEDNNKIYLVKEPDGRTKERANACVEKGKWYLENKVFPRENQDLMTMILKAREIRFDLLPVEGDLVAKFDSKEKYDHFFAMLSREFWTDHVDRIETGKPIREDIDPVCTKWWNKFHENYKADRIEKYNRYNAIGANIGSHWHHLGLFDAYGRPLDDLLYIRTNEPWGEKKSEVFINWGFTYVEAFGSGYHEKHNVTPEQANFYIKEIIKYEVNIYDEFFTCSEKLYSNKEFRQKYVDRTTEQERRPGFGKMRFRCAYCGKKIMGANNVTIDYVHNSDRKEYDSAHMEFIKGRDLGKVNNLDDAVFVCHTCNRKKGNSMAPKWEVLGMQSKNEAIWPIKMFFKRTTPLWVCVGAYLLICILL